MAALTVAGLMAAAPAWAQDTQAPIESRPAIASYWGDTGLWFLPTAEVLRPKGWSFSVYRTELDFNQGFSDLSFYPVTFAAGVGNRLEIFGAFRTVTAVDRDTRPLFVPGTIDDGGVVNEAPFVREGWTGNHFGDVYAGGKVNLASEHKQAPLAFALRGTVKMPTASQEDGLGTGQFDYFADVIASKEMGRAVEATFFTGVAWRGDPTGVSLSDGMRWGVGAAFGPRANLRFTAELHGEKLFDDLVLTAPGAVVGDDGSISPVITSLDSRTNAAFGLTWQHRSGMALGIGANYRFGLDQRSDAIAGAPDVSGDAWGLQLRLGFHKGVRVYTPPAPPPRIVEAPPAPPPPPVAEVKPAPPPPPPANRRPTLRAQCDPCRVEVGQNIAIRAVGTDADGDPLQYRWSTPSGTIADSRSGNTRWTAETVPGTVLLNVTADDGRGGTVTETLSVEVVRPKMTAIALDDVLFDFDKATLRPDGIQVLTKALKAMNDQPTAKLMIEGNASVEGSNEYNQELGERRAQAVREYLTKQGISPGRLSVVSYGEDRPKYDNTKEETRKLNRRAALVMQGEN
jgi:outer membrane protein OmpA-like peptidoglycan-associated protein